MGFSKRKKSSGLNGLFTQERLKEMLEVKDYGYFEYILPFVADFADRFSWACGHARKKHCTIEVHRSEEPDHP